MRMLSGVSALPSLIMALFSESSSKVGAETATQEAAPIQRSLMTLIWYLPT